MGLTIHCASPLILLAAAARFLDKNSSTILALSAASAPFCLKWQFLVSKLLISHTAIEPLSDR